MGKIFFFVVFKLFEIRAQYIIYDSGSFTNLCSGCSCQNSQTKQATLNFIGTFAKPPQIIITSFTYDLEPSTNEFYFSVSDVTQTSNNCDSLACKFNLYCPHVHLIWSYLFKWVAVDDQRIEVINSFNTSVAGYSNQIFTFPHKNVNALYGFITQTSFGFVGAFNHKLDIIQIDYHEVKVNFLADNANLQSIGFQVVLGTKEAFHIYSEITQVISLTPYNSPTINIPAGYFSLIPISALGYQNSYNMRISLSTTFTGSQMQYALSCWGDSVPANIRYSIIFINASNSKVLYPFQVLKMSFTKSYLQILDSNPWKLYVSELNQTYITTTTQTKVIAEAVQSLTITYSINCDPILITGTLGSVLQCKTCNPDIKNFSHNCSNEINTLKYHFILYQVDQINQEIFLNVTSSGFVLYQSIINREGQQNDTLIYLQIQNY